MSRVNYRVIQDYLSPKVWGDAHLRHLAHRLCVKDVQGAGRNEDSHVATRVVS